MWGGGDGGGGDGGAGVGATEEGATEEVTEEAATEGATGKGGGDGGGGDGGEDGGGIRFWISATKSRPSPMTKAPAMARSPRIVTFRLTVVDGRLASQGAAWCTVMGGGTLTFSARERSKTISPAAGAQLRVSEHMPLGATGSDGGRGHSIRTAHSRSCARSVAPWCPGMCWHPKSCGQFRREGIFRWLRCRPQRTGAVAAPAVHCRAAPHLRPAQPVAPVCWPLLLWPDQ